MTKRILVVDLDEQPDYNTARRLARKKRAYERRKAYEILACAVCGSPFPRTSPRRIYCGPDCNERARVLRRAKRGVGSDAECEICGESFRQHPHNRKTCSPQCSRALQERRKEERRVR